MNRLEQKETLIYKLGLLLGPLEEVARNPTASWEQFARARAKFLFDQDQFRNDIYAFANGETGHIYLVERIQIETPIGNLSSKLTNITEVKSLTKDMLSEVVRAFAKALGSIPTSVDSGVLSAQSPFTSYCLINDLCRTTSSRLMLVDTYLDESVFYRYLRHVSPSVPVTLVTFPEVNYNKSSKTRWTALMDVSRLFAKERGPNSYRLVTNSALHDRLLACDDQTYHLGPSVKDAGSKADFTVSKGEPPMVFIATIEQNINTGMELFGPSQPKHP